MVANPLEAATRAPEGERVRSRRHHNNVGLQQIRRGRTREQVKGIAQRIGVSYGKRASDAPEAAPEPAGDEVRAQGCPHPQVP